MDLEANYRNVAENIRGRIALSVEAAVLLQETIIDVGGDYIEIGTLYGGSAILAAMVCEGRVFAIDPLDGYNEAGRKDPVIGITPSREIFEENLAKFDVCVSIFQHKHPPWPKALKNHYFGVGFIDGKHDPDPCTKDYEALKDRCDCLIFDNTEVTGVMAVVERAVSEGWEISHQQEGALNGMVNQMTVVMRGD